MQGGAASHNAHLVYSSPLLAMPDLRTCAARTRAAPKPSQGLQLGRRVCHMLLRRHTLELVGDSLHDHGCGAAPPAGGKNADGVCQVAAGVAIKVAVRLQPEPQPARQDMRVSAERLPRTALNAACSFRRRPTWWQPSAQLVLQACT